MKRAPLLAGLALLAACGKGPPAIPPGPPFDPILFFTGTSHGEATLDQLINPARHVAVNSMGLTDAHGGLLLLQHIRVEGEKPNDRRWFIRRTGPGHYAATLSDASGPVAVEPVGGAIRIRYTMKSGFDVEQWLVPMRGGKALDNRLRATKWGVEVASLHEVIRKLD